jgi:FMN phosphatase YigB (HAD superfamily)
MLKNNKKLIDDKKLLLLDFDGVIVPGPNRNELKGFMNRSASIIAEHKKIPLNAARMLLNEQMIKNNCVTISQLFFIEYPEIDPEYVKECVFGEYNRYKYRPNGNYNEYISCALEKIKRCGLDIAILTNNSEDVVTEILPSLKLSSIIEIVIGSEQLNPLLKPETKAYMKALKILGHEASKTLFLDDSITNVIGAMIAGITSVYIGRDNEEDAVIRYKTLRSFLRTNT